MRCVGEETMAKRTFFRSGHRNCSVIFFFFFYNFCRLFDILVVEYGFYLNIRATTGAELGRT